MNIWFILLLIAQSTVFVTLIYIMLQYFQKSNKALLQASQEHITLIFNERKDEKQKESLRVILPLKIQASERLVLFLERIQPSVLIARHFSQELTASELSKSILNTIREEFEHNLSQQLFVSETAWQLTKAAREEVVQLFHVALSNLQEGSMAVELAKELIGAEIKLIEPAIQKLRDDLDKTA